MHCLNIIEYIFTENLLYSIHSMGTEDIRKSYDATGNRRMHSKMQKLLWKHR